MPRAKARWLLRAALLLTLAAAPALAAAPPPPGATACSGCHAQPARAGAAIPGLQGRPAAEVAAALLAFRRGEREATLMDRIARGFSEAELQAIAAWVVAPP